MKFLDVAVFGILGYALYRSLQTSGPAPLKDPESPIVPQVSGPTSTAVGPIPSVFAVPYNVKVLDVQAVGNDGNLYGTYEKNGQGFSGIIPNTAPTPQPSAPVNITLPSSATASDIATAQSYVNKVATAKSLSGAARSEYLSHTYGI